MQENQFDQSATPNSSKLVALSDDVIEYEAAGESASANYNLVYYF